MEQPAGLMERIRTVSWVIECFREYREIEPGGLAAWKKANPDKSKTVKTVQKMMNENGR